MYDAARKESPDAKGGAAGDGGAAAKDGAVAGAGAGAKGGAEAKGTPAKLNHRRVIPIVEPDPHDRAAKTWLAINADTGGVAFVLGAEHKGRAAAALALGTEEPMFDMYMVEMADGSATGFVGAENAEKAYTLAAKEEAAGAKAGDYPDLRPAPPNLQHQLLEPTVAPHGADGALTWMAIDKATGQPVTNLGSDYQGRDATKLPVGTKLAPYDLWMVPTKDGQGDIGSVGAENAGKMYDAARKESPGGGAGGGAGGGGAAHDDGAKGAAKGTAPAPTSGGAIAPGATLADIQARLNALGYACGAADGVMGPRTRAAIIAFQRDHHLDPDGVVGPLTRAALASG
ncbi:MAG: peptidoglycan-binding domain-containing protein [Myxococcota bacterium]